MPTKRRPRLIFLAVFLLTGLCVLPAARGAVPAGMVLVAENDFLRLFIDEATTEIAVEDKLSNDVWFSNPPGDQKAKGQIAIKYFAPGAVEGTMDSFNDSVAHEQYVIRPLDTGVRVEYTLGREYGEFALLPGLISEERAAALLERTDDEAAKRALQQALDRNFTRVTLTAVEEGAAATLPASLRVFDGYTLTSPAKRLTNNEVQRFLRVIQSRVMGERIDIEELADLTFDHVRPLIDIALYVLNDNLPSFIMRSAMQAFENVGYTMEDRGLDNTLFGLDPPRPRLERFKVAIEYRLDGPDLVVWVPRDSIEHPVDVIDIGGKYGPRRQKISLPIHSIRVLEFFGAADRNETGYMFVPDGSGALVHLNSVKTSMSQYTVPVYGEDLALGAPLERMNVTRRVHLPVFGLHYGEQAFLAVIEESAPSARISVAVSTGSGSFNRIWSEFVVRPQSAVDLTGEWIYSPVTGYWDTLSKVNVFQYRANEADIRLRYRFLHGENADYAGMAEAYRDYLIEKGALKKRLSPDDEPPFFVELVGAVKKLVPVLGIPRLQSVPLTTYQQASAIAERLAEAGVNRGVLRYLGWHNGGVEHDYPADIKLLGGLGTAADFRALNDVLSGLNWGFYPDVSLMYIYRDRLMDGFSPNRHASRTLDRRIARRYEYDVALFARDPDRASYVLSPRRLGHLVDRFLSSYASLGVPGLSLRHIGTALNSDQREELATIVDRTQAQEIVERQLAKLTQTHGLGLMINGGNDYALGYADYALQIPFSSSRADIYDRDVPFYQMVIHGLVDYAGEPINNAYDPVTQMLKTVEFGGNIYYQWAYAPSETVKETKFNDLYSLNYEDWLGSAIPFYLEIKDNLQAIRGLRMTGHETIAQGVSRTEYDGGWAVLVNYNHEPVVVDGIKVEALNYSLVQRHPSREGG